MNATPCYKVNGRYWELAADDGPKWLPWTWRWQTWIPSNEKRYSEFQSHKELSQRPRKPTAPAFRMLATVVEFLRKRWGGPPRPFRTLDWGFVIVLPSEDEVYEALPPPEEKTQLRLRTESTIIEAATLTVVCPEQIVFAKQQAT